MVGFGTGANKGEWLSGSCGTFALASGSAAIRFVDAGSEEHRGQASINELRIMLGVPTWPNGLLTCKTHRDGNEAGDGASVS